MNASTPAASRALRARLLDFKCELRSHLELAPSDCGGLVLRYGWMLMVCGLLRLGGIHSACGRSSIEPLACERYSVGVSLRKAITMKALIAKVRSKSPSPSQGNDQGSVRSAKPNPPRTREAGSSAQAAVAPGALPPSSLRTKGALHVLACADLTCEELLKTMAKTSQQRVSNFVDLLEHLTKARDRNGDLFEDQLQERLVDLLRKHPKSDRGELESKVAEIELAAKMISELRPWEAEIVRAVASATSEAIRAA